MVSINGIEMWCANGQLCCVFLIVAVFMADWPEQNLMACTSEGSCPICVALHCNQGQLTGAPLRQQGQTLEVLMAYFDNNNDPGKLKELNLKPVWPWWATIPYVNFATCIAPDLLHQLYQGVFKTHLMGWLQHMVGSNEVDKCLMAMPKAEGLCHFLKGVSSIGPRQWTGCKSKDLVKQVLPIAIGKCSPEFTELVWSVVDFIHQAHSASMTDRDINVLQHSLNTLHELKEIMVNLVDGYYKDVKRWDKIAKLHMMEHYAHSIHKLGMPDRYNTEGPKNLHIIYAKEPWRASNKHSPLPQMTKYLQQLDAIRIQCHYMDSYFGVELDPDLDNQDEGEHVDNGTERKGGGRASAHQQEPDWLFQRQSVLSGLSGS
ncbi:hypothetical protein OPQ81_002149 [Rhizoctonia solani]|nr:hypothetical protein OPQ81_002149 [Rhizoctonia solani]